MSDFFSLSPERFTLLATIIGILLTENLDLDQQNSLGNFITSIGQAMMTAAAQGQLLQSEKQQNEEVRQQLQLIKDQINLIEKKLK